MAIYLPENLNLENIIEKNPPHEITNFRIEKVIYILDLITRIPVSNRKINVKNGFVPICTKALQDKFTDCCQYLKYLKRIGIIECDYYIPGEKCRGYRFSKAYMGKVVPYKPQTKPRKNSILNQYIKSTDNANVTYPYLIKWFNENLVIDYSSALDRLVELQAKYIPKGNTEEEKERSKNAFYCSHLRSITDFYYQDFRALIDDFGHRLHTNITNVSKKYRSLITINGETPTSIDIGSSQPYLSTILLNEQFYQHDSTAQTPTYIPKTILTDVIYTTEYINREREGIEDTPLMVLSFQDLINKGDVEKYKNLVSDGTIYDYFADRVVKMIGQDFVKYCLKLDLSSRGQKKELFFKSIFSDNTFFDQQEAAHVRMFQREFPSVYQIFYEIKKHDKDDLVKCLQRLESYLVLNVICRQFAEQHPDIPLYTIHDCMITIVSHIQYLTQIAEKVLTEATGLKPKLKPEDWRKE